MYKDKFVSLIITAAGLGQRMGASVPKLELEIAGRPIIDYTLDKFRDLEFLDEIVIATSIDLLEAYKARYQAPKIKIVRGGKKREDSTYQAIKALDKRSQIVITHDGARPFVEKKDIINVLDLGLETGAAIVAVPATDTIKVTDGKKVLATPDRSNLVNVQTPQVFETQILRAAYDTYIGTGGLTDDSSFVEKLGAPVAIYIGSYDNIKITTQKDLELARRML